MANSSDWPGRREAVLNLSSAYLNDVASQVKLLFGLDTGAIVLFVKILTDSRSPTPVLIALAFSIFFFGLSAFWCLFLLGGLIDLRRSLLVAIGEANPTKLEEFERGIEKWDTRFHNKAVAMSLMFIIAVAFAGVFVIGVLATR